MGSTRTLLVLIFWESHPGQSLGAVVSVHPEGRVKESPHANRNRNRGGLQQSAQLRAGDTRGFEPPGGCEPGLLPCGPSGPQGPSRTPGCSLRPGGPGGSPRGRGWAGRGAVSRPPRGGRARPLPSHRGAKFKPRAPAQRDGAGPGSPGPAGLHGECAGTPPCPWHPSLSPALRSSSPDSPPWSALAERSPPRCRDGVGSAGLGLQHPRWGLGPVGRWLVLREWGLDSPGEGLALVSGWGLSTWERAWSTWNGAGLGPNGTWSHRDPSRDLSWESVRKGLGSGWGSWSSWDQAAGSGMRLRPPRWDGAGISLVLR